MRLCAALLAIVPVLIVTTTAGSQGVSSGVGSQANVIAPLRFTAKLPADTPPFVLRRFDASKVGGVDLSTVRYRRPPSLASTYFGQTQSGSTATTPTKQSPAAHVGFLTLGIAGSTVVGLDIAARAGALGDILQCGPASPECSRHSDELLIGGLAAAFVGFFFAFHHSR